MLALPFGNNLKTKLGKKSARDRLFENHNLSYKDKKNQFSNASSTNHLSKLECYNRKNKVVYP